MELNKELLEKAKEAKSVEELLALAKDNGIGLTEEEAKTYFTQLNPKNGEVNDDELDSVAGGKKCGTVYMDGRPFVTALNSCEYWKDENTYEAVPNGGYCKDCLHGHTSSFGYHCMAAERYNN